MSFAWTIVALVVVIAIAWRFLGSYMAAVFQGRVRWLSWLERPIYRLTGVDAGCSPSCLGVGWPIICCASAAPPPMSAASAPAATPINRESTCIAVFAPSTNGRPRPAASHRPKIPVLA